MTRGYVYLLGNSAMPGIYKIGRTTGSPFHRADSLSRGTSVPAPFKVLTCAGASDCAHVESVLHRAFSEHRVSRRREFFKFGPHELTWAWSAFRFLPERFDYWDCPEWAALMDEFDLFDPFDESGWSKVEAIDIPRFQQATQASVSSAEFA